MLQCGICLKPVTLRTITCHALLAYHVRMCDVLMRDVSCTHLPTCLPHRCLAQRVGAVLEAHHQATGLTLTIQVGGRRPSGMASCMAAWLCTVASCMAAWLYHSAVRSLHLMLVEMLAIASP